MGKRSKGKIQRNGDGPDLKEIKKLKAEDLEVTSWEWVNLRNQTLANLKTAKAQILLLTQNLAAIEEIIEQFKEDAS